MKKVRFHIFNKSAEQTANIMRKVLKKYKYIKVLHIDNKCLIESDQIDGSLNTWLVERLVCMKRFLGKWHRDHSLFNQDLSDKISEKYKTCISRFGFWTSADDPEEMEIYEYDVYKTSLRLKGVPSYKAAALARRVTGFEDKIPDINKPWLRNRYIQELVDYYGLDREQATKKVDRYYKSYDIPLPPKEEIDPEVVKVNHEKANKRFNDMIETLRFLSTAKERARWLKRNDDFIGGFLLASLLAKNGREWFVENVGEIEGIT